MTEHLRSAGLAALQFARENILKMAEDIPKDKLCHQPVAGGNHTLWILGHLAQTDDYFLTQVSNRETGCPTNYMQLFGMGSKPSSQASDYPTLAEVHDQLRERREDLNQWFKSMNPEQLLQPLPGDFVNFAPNFGTLMSTIAWHEGMHTGQLTMIRRSLNIGPKFG